MLLCMAMLCACSKEGPEGKQGAKGDRGEQGDKGEQGLQGPQGISGNAGVMMYTYGSRTIKQETSYNFPITSEEVANSLIYAYFQLSGGNAWYPVPCTVGYFYDVKNFLWLYTEGVCDFHIILYTANSNTVYPTAVTWSAFRIIVVPIPAENIVGIEESVSALDLSNYSAVAGYYGLPQ